MGTRADFYVGRGEKAKWLGSIAWDAYPDGIDSKILNAKTEKEYKAALKKFFATRNDVSRPANGWPWPWKDSGTTDYAYTFDRDKNRVLISPFGREYVSVRKHQQLSKDDEAFDKYYEGKLEIFPNMENIQKVTMGKRSGLTVIGQKPGGGFGIIEEE